jgi:hypothetical protein
MIRAFAALAAASALAACDASATPSRADVRNAVRQDYALGAPTLPMELRNARITGVGECRQFDDAFQCPMEVENASRERVPLSVWLKRESGEWRVQSIAVTGDWP